MASLFDPDQELRFTRSRQATYFALLSAILFSAFVTLLVTFTTVYYEFGTVKDLPYTVLWLPVLLMLTVISGGGSYHCLTKPYVILSPMGVEIFPFLKPLKNFQIIEWGRIVEIETAPKRVTLHFNSQKSRGVVLSLIHI